MLRKTIQIKAYRQDEGAKTTNADDQLRKKFYERIERGNAFAEAEEDARRMLYFGTRNQYSLYNR